MVVVRGWGKREWGFCVSWAQSLSLGNEKVQTDGDGGCRAL